MKLTHVTEAGRAQMVDIGKKTAVRRDATARGKIFLRPETIELIERNGIRKGDALAVARIAGIQAGKKTSELIPLCHNIPIDRIDVDFIVGKDGIVIEAQASCHGKTGIEMEALTAVAAAALCIYDMCKAVDTSMVIGDIALVNKSKS